MVFIDFDRKVNVGRDSSFINVVMFMFRRTAGINRKDKSYTFLSHFSRKTAKVILTSPTEMVILLLVRTRTVSFYCSENDEQRYFV